MRPSERWRKWREAKRREAEEAAALVAAMGMLVWALRNPDEFHKQMEELSSEFTAGIRALQTPAEKPPDEVE